MSNLHVLPVLTSKPVAEPDTYEVKQAWQQHILTELGITRWVAQQAKVVDAVMPVATATNVPEATAHGWGVAAFGSHPQTTVSPMGLATQAPTGNLLAPVVETVAESAPDLAGSLPASEGSVQATSPLVLVKRFRIQAMAYKDWLILVDEQDLQQDSRQQALWQQISHHLQACIHPYTFPLLETVDHLPISTQQMMANVNIAMAAFEGFVYAVTAGQHTHVGRVSALPTYFDKMPVTPLPSLYDMLQDGQKKREFWQRLTTMVY